MSDLTNLDEQEEEELLSDFAERKAYQRTRNFTTVKTGINALCRNNQDMLALIQDCVRRCSFIAAEASLLTSIHVLRILNARYPQYQAHGGQQDGDVELNDVDENEEVPLLNDTFFNQCVSCIANLAGSQANNNIPLQDTLFRHYLPLKPEGYIDVGRIPGVMSQMLVIIAHQARQNFVVSTEATMHKRLLRWLDLQIRTHQVDGDYFSTYGAYNGKSIKALMLRACLEDVQVAAIMVQYKRIRENEIQIPPEELVWMQELCTEVKVALDISPEEPFDVGKRPEAYMPFLFRMLFELGGGEEGEGEGGGAEEEVGGGGGAGEEEGGGAGGGGGEHHYRLFSLLPQKQLKPIYITINNTILKEMHLYLDDSGFNYFQGELTLFEFYFDFKKLLKMKKAFECQIMTDGVGASIVASGYLAVHNNATGCDCFINPGFARTDRFVVRVQQDN